MVYWYESAFVTCLAAWGTTLTWERGSNLPTSTPLLKGLRFALPFGIAGAAFWLMRNRDYYNQSLDKHASWLVFQGALGATVANLAKVAFSAASPWRYVAQDCFVLWAYSYGY